MGDGELEIAGVRAVGGDVLGVLGREWARQGGESETGLLLVLRRARVGELRLCSELSTTTARWRPRSSSGWRGEGRRGEVQRVGRWVQQLVEVPREAAAKLEVAWAGPEQWAAALNSGGGEIEKQTGGRRKVD